MNKEEKPSVITELEYKDLIPFLEITDNAIPLPLVGNFLKIYSNTKEMTYGEVGGPDDFKKALNIRKVLTYDLNNLSKSLTDVHWSNLLTFFINKAIKDFQNKHDLQIGKGRVNELQLLKYEEGHFYNYHVDGTTMVRNLSCIIFLNDDYEGGEVCFYDVFNKREILIKPKAGRLILWPSNFLYPHKVNKVSKGVRFTVVSWII